MEIIWNKRNLILVLSYLPLILSQQEVRFISGYNPLSNSEKIHTAHLSAIGKGIDPETKTILCLAKKKEETKRKLYNGSFIEAEITTNEKEAKALPSHAILKSGPYRYVFVIEKSDAQNYYLRKEKIKTGTESKGFTEITGSKNLVQVLTKGAYNISLD